MNYDLQVWGLNDATVSHDGIISEHYDGLQWDWYFYENNTFSLNSSATPSTLNISDTDLLFSDDSEDQTSTNDVTIDGTLYPAGTNFQNEYEINLTDGTNTYTMVAISTRVYSDPWNWTDTIIGFTFEGAVPPVDTDLTYVFGSAKDQTSMVVCFTSGTMIATPKGSFAVETLRAGDEVLSPDGNAHALIWTGRQHLRSEALAAVPKLRPVRIEAGALAPSVPSADLLVSPQHRILVRSAATERLCGAREALVAAKHLIGIPGIGANETLTEVTYIHLLCAQHVVLTANGAETESFFPGEQALLSLTFTARRQIASLTEKMGPLIPARPLLSGRLGRVLAEHHAKSPEPSQEACRPSRLPAPDAA
jgi:hypothetical protein